MTPTSYKTANQLIRKANLYIDQNSTDMLLKAMGISEIA